MAKWCLTPTEGHRHCRRRLETLSPRFNNVKPQLHVWTNKTVNRVGVGWEGVRGEIAARANQNSPKKKSFYAKVSFGNIYDYGISDDGPLKAIRHFQLGHQAFIFSMMNDKKQDNVILNFLCQGTNIYDYGISDDGPLKAIRHFQLRHLAIIFSMMNDKKQDNVILNLLCQTKVYCLSYENLTIDEIICIVADDSPPVGAIVGSIIGVVIVAAVIIAAVILWRKRTSHKSKAKGSENQSLTNLHTAKSLQNDKSKDISQDFEESSLDTPYNNDDVNTSIPLHELTKFMETHHKDFFSKQFKKIPAPKNISTEIAQSEENRNKNRYKNICPYDHSRVHLKINTGKKEGDYINASYIRGFTDEATFIAAQGPNNLVINDFIRMLWEQKIKKVVMLTNLIEEGKVKCEKYWPDKDKVTYGEIEVKLAQTQTFTDYCLRIIELSKQSEITHIVTQYHFTSWPDQGIPYAPWAIIDFSEKVFSTISSDLIVVHCSAGVGRTGTFIALYNVLRQAEETGHIDFFKTLSKLREDRTLMIQTADQYEFLHIAAQAALACKGTSVTASNIRERLRHLEQREVSGLTKMKKEFQAIDKLCKDIRKAHSEDKENGDICNSTYQNTADLKINEKNRFPSIVPRNADRPYLICDSSETGDYINAVFIPSLKKRDQLILTQLPMPTTVVDFWRLVEQYKVRLAVAFEKDKLATDKTIAIHIPTTKNMILQSMPFEIKCDHFKEDELWEEQTLTLYHEKSKSDSHELMHLQCKFSDLDSRKLLTFVKKIRSYNLHADGKILFMCRNGATYSGLCCAVSLLLDRMDSDSCASVPLVVSIMKTVRPEIIPSVHKEKQQLVERIESFLKQYQKPLTFLDVNTKITESDIAEAALIALSDVIEKEKDKDKRDVLNNNFNMLCLYLDKLSIAAELGALWKAVQNRSLKKRDQLILTQLPMPTTVVDFWRLVEQYKVRLAVAFEKEKLATDKTIAIHIPTTKNMILQSMPFEIKCDHFKEDELWEEQTLTLYHEKSKSDSHELMHLQCKFSDLDARKLLTFVKKIRSYNLHADGKILFMCRNGATYSGLCCAVSLLLDRMDSDSCASVPLVVSIMKTVRPEIIPSVEQYKLLYDALERYTDVSSPYSNVDENFFPRGLKQSKVNKPTTDQTAADDESIYNNV
ncbi:hypothetical protein Btru_007312 [Bulinus truncatus]|nr:hypothetical protein Btru_007312 [Bulinus truncatus]